MASKQMLWIDLEVGDEVICVRTGIKYKVIKIRNLKEINMICVIFRDRSGGQLTEYFSDINVMANSQIFRLIKVANGNQI